MCCRSATILREHVVTPVRSHSPKRFTNRAVRGAVAAEGTSEEGNRSARQLASPTREFVSAAGPQGPLRTLAGSLQLLASTDGAGMQVC